MLRHWTGTNHNRKKSREDDRNFAFSDTCNMRHAYDSIELTEFNGIYSPISISIIFHNPNEWIFHYTAMLRTQTPTPTTEYRIQYWYETVKTQQLLHVIAIVHSIDFQHLFVFVLGNCVMYWFFFSAHPGITVTFFPRTNISRSSIQANCIQMHTDNI